MNYSIFKQKKHCPRAVFHQKLTNLTLNKIFKLQCKYMTDFQFLQGSCNKLPSDVIFGKNDVKKNLFFVENLWKFYEFLIALLLYLQ